MSTIELEPMEPLAQPATNNAMLKAISRRRDARFGIATSAVMTLLDQAVASGVNFVSGVIIGRSASADEFGCYMLGLSVLLFATILQSAVISTPFLVFRPQLSEREGDEYAGSTLVQQLVFSLFFTVLLVIAAYVITSMHGPADLSRTLWVLVPASALILLKEHVRRYCFASLRPGSALQIDVVLAVLQLTGLLLLARSSQFSSAIAYVWIAVGCAAAVLPWLYVNRNRFLVQRQRFAGDLRRSWSLGRWVFGSFLLWALGMYIYPWLLAATHGLDATGMWAACFGIVAISNPALIAAQNVLEARIAKAYADGGAPRLRRVAGLSSLLLTSMMLLFAAVIFFAGEQLAVLVYGDQYVGSGRPAFVLALASVAGAANFPFSCALFVIDRARVDFAISFAHPVVLLGLGIWLVMQYGPFGAALGIMTANMVTFAIRVFIFLALFRTPRAKAAACS